MKAPLLAAATGLVLFCGHLPAVAATATPAPADAKPVIADAQAMKAADQVAMAPMRRQIEDQLTKNGYTDVSVMPSSFLVRAKDKAGNPVEMVIGPDSLTTVTEIAPKGRCSAGPAFHDDAGPQGLIGRIGCAAASRRGCRHRVAQPYPRLSVRSATSG